MSRGLVACGAVLLAATTTSNTASAQAAPKRLDWDPHWSRFGWGDAAVTVGLGATALVTALVPTSPRDRRSGAVLFDDAVHGVVQGGSDAVRPGARLASDVLVAALVLYPFAIDAAGTVWWRRRSPDVAWQMALINAEAMAVNQAVHGVVSLAVARERPYGPECGKSLDAGSAECEADGRRYRSFYSSHTANAFNSASLICVHHLKLKLLGGVGDAITCATAMAAATAVGTLRIAGDMHWATDVVTGAAMGSLFGFGVPLLHYAGGIPTFELSRRSSPIRAAVVPTGLGLGMTGVF